jgi:hypothetical protein
MEVGLIDFHPPAFPPRETTSLPRWRYMVMSPDHAWLSADFEVIETDSDTLAKSYS